MTMKRFEIRDFLRVANGEIEPPPCDTMMNIRVTAASEGESTGTWTVDDSFINGNGVVMGGFLSSAADIMMAYAIASKLEDHQGFASINLDTTFHRPVTEGVVTVHARVDRLGKRVAYVIAELYQHDKKAATCQSSIFIT